MTNAYVRTWACQAGRLLEASQRASLQLGQDDHGFDQTRHGEYAVASSDAARVCGNVAP